MFDVVITKLQDLRDAHVDRMDRGGCADEDMTAVAAEYDAVIKILNEANHV